MRNRYAGYCYKCGKRVEPGFGFFERHNGAWRVQCVKCCDGRDVKESDREVQRAIRMRNKGERNGKKND